VALGNHRREASQRSYEVRSFLIASQNQKFRRNRIGFHDDAHGGAFRVGPVPQERETRMQPNASTQSLVYSYSRSGGGLPPVHHSGALHANQQSFTRTFSRADLSPERPCAKREGPKVAR